MINLIRPIVPSIKHVLPYFQQSIDARQFANFGPCHEQLIRRMSAIAGGFAVPTISGTAAIEFALLALGLEPGSRVIVPDFTHVGTIIAVKRAGMVPVLCRVKNETWVLDEAEISAERSRFDAVIVVSPFGYHVDVASWDRLSKDLDFPIVYDFAGAFGFFPKSSNPICYSMHATKNMGIGEAGIMVWPTLTQANTAKRLINFDLLPDRSIASLNGNNAKLDELRCAFALAAVSQPHLGHVTRRIEYKRRLLDFYCDALKIGVPDGPKSPSLCVLPELPADKLEAAGIKEGIVFRKYYPLLSRMQAVLDGDVEIISESDAYMDKCCALPSDADLVQAQDVVKFVKRYL